MPAPKGHAPYNILGEGGRPREWTDEKLDELADDLIEWLERARIEKKEFWWHEWCWDHGIQPSKVIIFAQRHERFRLVYEYIKEWQESIVTKGALSKKLSEGFTKFYLCNKYSHNWKSIVNDDNEKIPPRDEIIEKENENMILKAQLTLLSQKLSEYEAKFDNQSQARQELPGVNP